PRPYLLEALEVTIPLPATHVEILDFTGRHERERSPQRHLVNDGLWVRESRRGKPGLDSASVLVAGTPGFSFGTGQAVPGPVTLNVWEAVYFDHDAERLERIAELAASVGVERFVLDDGWFLGRRDDTAGLGDWWVDETVWPHGLQRLSDRVHKLGMKFGLWF